MGDDLIRRKAAIDAFYKYPNIDWTTLDVLAEIKALPSALPEISRIEQKLHGKTPEEQYEFLYWLLLKFGLAYTDSRLAVIEWLRGEKDGND